MSESLLDLLRRVQRLESHSFLLYVRDAGEARVAPYAREIKRTLDEVIAHEEEYLDIVLSLVEQHGGYPDYAMAYDMNAAHYHYLNLPYLVQVVHEKLAAQLAAFRRVTDRVRDVDPATADRLAEIARRKATDLQKIESLLERVREKQGTAAVENNRTVGQG